MLSTKRVIAAIASAVFLLPFAVTGAASALTASCAGAVSVSNITWTASSSGAVTPVAYLWGNGSTSSAQTVAVLPGTYSMTLQATDASSTIATSTCAATVNVTSSATAGDIQSQIQSLLNQIADLKAQIAALAQAHNNLQHQALQLIGTLHRGMSGDDVRKLQEVLATDKDVFSKDDVTGFFGPLTEEAVKRFQHHFGIDVVGMVGPHTLEKINELLRENNVMDDGDFRDGEIGNIGDSNDSEHGTIDFENTENTDNGDAQEVGD